MKVKSDRIKLGKKWLKLIPKIDPMDYMDENAKFLVKQIKQDLAPATEKGSAGDFDCFALFEGKVGMGKTNTSNLICMAIDPTYQDAVIRKESRAIYRDWHYWKAKNKLTKNLRNDPDCCRGKAINIDQLQRVLFSKDAMNPETIKIEKDLSDIRALGLFIAACIDDVKSILRYARETRIDLWFYCRKRGEIWIYKLYTTGRDNFRAERRIAYLKKQLMQGIHPYTPYKIYIKAIPKNSLFWVSFKQREMRYKGSGKDTKKENIKLKVKEDIEKMIDNTLSFSEARRTLKVSKATLSRWANDGKVAYVDTYRGRRFKTKAVEKLATEIYGMSLRRPVKPYNRLSNIDKKRKKRKKNL